MAQSAKKRTTETKRKPPASKATVKDKSKAHARQQRKASPPPSKAKLARTLQARELETRRYQEQLVHQYLPYATSIANRIAQSVSSSVDYDDILCNARLGLLEAAQRFDIAHEVDFRTFAYYRIKGAIYDGLRKSGWIPRSLYAKIKFEEAANDYLQNASHEEAQKIHEDKKENATKASETVNSLASIYVISIDASEDMEIADNNSVDVEERATLQQVRSHMRIAINQLPPKEKQLIMMYYFQNRTLEEAGQRLKLSKSWTSRLHARALGMLMKNIKRLTRGGEHAVEMMLGVESDEAMNQG